MSRVGWSLPSRTACILSIDIAGFTPLSVMLGAKRVVELLHELWCLMDTALDDAAADHKNRDYAEPLLVQVSGDSRNSDGSGNGLLLRNS